jgi:glycosyltransferase involved in cell wall biosynthesis
VYNLENYIEKTLESVKNQTYKNLEVIIIDDSSTDNSYQKIENYKGLLEEEGCNVKILKTPKNSGVMYATCLGLENITGDIVTFLDGDDLWHKDKIKEVVSKFEEDNYILVSHDYEYINQYDEKLNKNDFTQEPLKQLSLENRIDEISELMKDGIKYPRGLVWLGSAYALNANLLDVKEYIKMVKNSKYPIEYLYQDWPLASYVVSVSKKYKFGYVNKKLFKYRLHDDNYSGGNKMDTKKALRNATKGYYTSLFIEDVFNTYKDNFGNEYKKIIQYRQNITRNYQFLINLYSNKFIEALKDYKFLKKNFWNNQESKKQLIRLIGYFILREKLFQMKYSLKKVKS